MGYGSHRLQATSSFLHGNFRSLNYRLNRQPKNHLTRNMVGGEGLEPPTSSV